MPESFIPVWMSIGEAEEFRRFLRDEATTTDGEFPEREFGLIDGALETETPRTFDAMQAERGRDNESEPQKPVNNLPAAVALSKLAKTWAALEAIQGDAYLWQVGDSPWSSPDEAIEHLRKTARNVLRELGLDKQSAPTQQSGEGKA